MRLKRSAIGVLVAVNLLLLVALLVGSSSLPPAYAQIAGRSGNFVCATAKAGGQSYDVLYLLDVTSRQLNGFYPVRANRNQLSATKPRDLTKDFQRQ